MQRAGIHKFRQKEVLWTPLWIAYANKRNVQMETGPKYFVKRASRYFLLDMVRDGKICSKALQLVRENSPTYIYVHTHRSARERHVKFLTHYKMRWRNWGMICESKSISHPSSAFYFQLFSGIVFSYIFFRFQNKNIRSVKCLSFKNGKTTLKKKKENKVLGKNRERKGKGVRL